MTNTYAFTPPVHFLPKPKGKRIASFCSGGDLGFLLQHQYDVSVDVLVIDNFHSAFVDLKRYAYSNLQESGFQTIMGMNKAGRRVFLYHQIRKELIESSRKYFDRNEQIIRTGLEKQFLYETCLNQFVHWKPRCQTKRFSLWMDLLGSRLHWIPFRTFRKYWRDNTINIQEWYESPKHYKWTSFDRNKIQISITTKSLYSDMYLFEPSEKQIFNSIPFLKSRGMLWVWSWNDLVKLGFQRGDSSIRSPFQPPLFFMQKSV